MVGINLCYCLLAHSPNRSSELIVRGKDYPRSLEWIDRERENIIDIQNRSIGEGESLNNVRISNRALFIVIARRNRLQCW